MNIEANARMTDYDIFHYKNDSDKKSIFYENRKIEAPEFVRLVEEGQYIEIFKCIMENSEITLTDDRFVYFLDFNYIPPLDRGVVWDNISVNYAKIVNLGLKELKYNNEDSKYCRDHNSVVDSIAVLAKRIVSRLETSTVKNKEKKIEYFTNLTEGGADSFEEAIQRILFINQILWQTNHPLMGFGLLDTILHDIYEKDRSIDKDAAINIICDFYRTLHRYYWYKSHALLGDTGQLVIVGRTNPDGSYFCNELTYAFIEALEKVHLPDPKVLLRVSSKTPRNLIETSIRCIQTGIGAPVFANDDKIIPILIKDGVKIEDAYNYTTSACWEPLPYQCPISNNLTVLNFITSFNNMMKREPLHKISTYEELVSRYKFYLARNINAAKRSLYARRFSYDPFISCFIDGCFEKKKDVSSGGANYYDYGMTTIGLGNVINSFRNIKKYVYEKNIMSLNDVRTLILTNFENHEEMRSLLKDDKSYGRDDDETVKLTNEIIKVVIDETKDFRNYLGGKLKFGLSSPAYVDAGRVSDASFDGRRKGEALIVHISSDSPNGYTELVNFSTRLLLDENSYNGNVVDFIVTPNIIQDNFDKFVHFIEGSIKNKVFEMQIGVLSSEQLLEAKKDPDKYPGLIVRVWGFSALFNDLPEEYQNVVIERALRSEGKYAG